MKSIIDTRKLESRARIIQVMSFGGMIFLLGGVVLLFQKPNLGFDTSSLAVVLVVTGFTIANSGIYLANRWLKRPRPEDVLDSGLKPLTNTTRLYHYLLPADHVLLTPSGLIVFEVVALDGKFTYHDGRWSRKFNLARSLRMLVEERVGDPIRRANSSAEKIKALIADSVSGPQPPVESMVIFTSPLAELDVDSPPIPVTNGHRINKRLPFHQDRLPTETYNQLRAVLDREAGLVDSEE